MASDGQPVDRLRQYLRMLSPQARAMLLVELERGLLSGEESAGNDIVLQELRRAIRAEARKVPRIADAARLFFVPVEPFLIDCAGDHKYAGRIARGSLESIWEWIGRDLIPDETKALTQDIHRALLANDCVKSDQLVRVLHERAIHRMKEVLAAVGSDEKAQRRLSVHVGTARALDDVATLLTILELREVLAELAAQLPEQIRIFDRDQMDLVKAHLDSSAAVSKLLDRTAARKSDIFLYGLGVVADRLATPWQLIRIAIRAAESDDPVRIAETPYAVAVTIALNEFERMVGELQAEFKAGRPVATILKELHDGARAVRAEMDLSVDSPWSRQLAAICSEVSNLFKFEIEATPSRLRRLLGPRLAKEIAAGSALNSIDVDDAENRVKLVVACRHYASELALSEATMRALSEMTHYLEIGTKALLEALRNAGAVDRPFRQSQVDAAIRFCRTVFGGEYAGLLAKAAEVAVNAMPAEPKSATVS